jgi:hypothetical protein
VVLVPLEAGLDQARQGRALVQHRDGLLPDAFDQHLPIVPGRTGLEPQDGVDLAQRVDRQAAQRGVGVLRGGRVAQPGCARIRGEHAHGVLAHLQGRHHPSGDLGEQLVLPGLPQRDRGVRGVGRLPHRHRIGADAQPGDDPALVGVDRPQFRTEREQGGALHHVLGGNLPRPGGEETGARPGRLVRV